MFRRVVWRARYAAALLVVPALLGAQSIAVGGPSSAFTHVAPGSVFSLTMVVDLSAAGGTNLAALTSAISWVPGRLTLDSIITGSFGTLTSTIGPGAASVASFSANGTTTTATIANLFFTASGTTGGTQVLFAPSAAGNVVGTSVLPIVASRPLNVCIAPIGGHWGDANNDAVVNIIDAQQVARFSVGLTVANAVVLAAQGDVTADGTVNIIDAQQIARFAVALSAPARVGTTRPQVPAVASVQVTPASPSIAIGATAQLSATPFDASSVDLTGCANISWSTTDPTRATVNADGLVTVLAPGVVSIVASTNGQTASTPLSTFAPVGSIAVVPDTATMPMGTAVQITPTLRDASNNILTGRTVTYTSSDPTVATVSASGLVTTSTVGLVQITARSGGVSAVTTIQAAPLPKNSLATGDTHTCALTVTGAAYCWGLNSSGQLGDGTSANSSTPVQAAAPPGVVFTQISATAASTCALSSKQDIYCWGQVFGAQFITVIPTLQTSSLKASSISVGNGLGCVLDLANAAWCWGTNTRGQLGTGDLVSSAIPRAVAGGLTFQSISVGLFGPCGLSSSLAYCWGDNSLRTIGNPNTSTPTLVPTAVTGGTSFITLNAGAVTSCGTTSGGIAMCWGTNQFGSLGNGSTTAGTQVAPATVAGTVSFASVSPGIGNNIFDTTCGLATDGTAYCWGINTLGEVGTSATLPNSCTSGTTTAPCTGVPTAVQTSAKFSVLAAGSEQNCGITTTHTVLCWGRNSSGQLGDGTTTNQALPVLVQGNLRFP